MLSKRKLLYAIVTPHTLVSALYLAALGYAVYYVYLSSPAAVAAILGAYFVYYRWVSVGVTVVHHDGHPCQRQLEQRLPLLKEGGYQPTMYMMNANVQTLYAALGRPLPSLPFEREFVQSLLADGEVCVLDWLFASRVADHPRKAPVVPHEAVAAFGPYARPCVILFHGLTGGTNDVNIYHLAYFIAHDLAWDVVIPLRRGCADELTMPKHYAYGGLEDTAHVVSYIASRINAWSTIAVARRSGAGSPVTHRAREHWTPRDSSPKKPFPSTPSPHERHRHSMGGGSIEPIGVEEPFRPLLALGISAGSNVMCNYLAEYSGLTRVLGGVSVANGYCWNKGTAAIRDHHPVWDVVMSSLVNQKLFHRHDVMVKTMAQAPISETPMELFPGAAPRNEVKVVTRTSSLREYDEAVSRRLHGFDSLEDFYAEQSCAPRLPKVHVPTVFLNALDDPIASATVIPTSTISANPNLILVTTPSGGHLGWAEGWWPFRLHSKTFMDRFVLEALYAVLGEAASRVQPHQRTAPQ